MGFIDLPMPQNMAVFNIFDVRFVFFCVCAPARVMSTSRGYRFVERRSPAKKKNNKKTKQTNERTKKTKTKTKQNWETAGRETGIHSVKQTADRQTDRQTLADRQTDRLTDRQTDGQTDRQDYIHTDRPTDRPRR